MTVRPLGQIAPPAAGPGLPQQRMEEATIVGAGTALAREADMASMMTDSTLIRAYMHAASERKAKRRARPWLGRDPGL